TSVTVLSTRLPSLSRCLMVTVLPRSASAAPRFSDLGLLIKYFLHDVEASSRGAVHEGDDLERGGVPGVQAVPRGHGRPVVRPRDDNRFRLGALRAVVPAG